MARQARAPGGHSRGQTGAGWGSEVGRGVGGGRRPAAAAGREADVVVTDLAEAAGCSPAPDVVRGAGSVVDGAEQDLGCVSRFLMSQVSVS